MRSGLCHLRLAESTRRTPLAPHRDFRAALCIDGPATGGRTHLRRPQSLPPGAAHSQRSAPTSTASIAHG